ncbi:MAG: SUMF1/EgtB/PvdO family nonheme iron enzyme [Pseudomonadales bacterium]
MPKQEQSYDKNNPSFPFRVIKGGSFLCAPNFCARYRPAARHAQDTGLGAGHIGFRTVLIK